MLKEYIEDSRVVTVIGLCKNAGKTTAMRQLMAELDDEVLGLTSVGRDGESTDLTTGTEKPELYIKRGDLFATARGMLTLCDTTCAVETLTDVMTPLGGVAVLRALSDGFVQLAGPSAAGQLPGLAECFRSLGAQRILIDGAAGRRSLASAGTNGCTILCAGASLNRDLNAVVAEAAHVAALFQLKQPEQPLQSAVEEIGERFALFTLEGEPLPLPAGQDGEPAWRKLPREHCAVWAGGAVTDVLIKTLAGRGAPTTVIAGDPTRILAGKESVAMLMRAGGTMAVRQPLKLAAVCANPWSAYGWTFEPQKFLELLRENVALPVVNVREGR